MILLLNTSTPVCILRFDEGDTSIVAEWEANRELAHGLLGFIEDTLQKHHKSFEAISAIIVKSGPGSFTGLRIGITVMNTLADALGVAIVGEAGEGWEERGIERLENGENDRIILPFYDSEPHITPSRK